MNYTYDQFQQAMKSSGLEGNFSQADLALAQRNPDAGMSLLSYKRDYARATTPEQRELANKGAEEVRTQWGGYTGGADGAGYYLSSPTPSSWASGTPAPQYKDSTAQQRQAVLNEIAGYGPYSYDPKKDPLYGQYKKAYLREGQRAMQDTLGSTAAASAGMPSSYAQTAAQQAYNYYAAQAADKIPDLEQQAYNKYLNEFSRLQSQYNTLDNERLREYNQFLGDQQQWNANREFGYGQHLDQIDYDNQRRANQKELAALLYEQTGDASGYADLGITPEQVAAMNAQWNENRAWELAANKGQVGDLSGYTGLADTAYAAALQQAELDKLTRENADWKAGYYDYSGLRENGVDTSALEALLRQKMYGGGSGGMNDAGAGGNQNTVALEDILDNKIDGDYIQLNDGRWMTLTDAMTGLADGSLRRINAGTNKSSIVVNRARDWQSAEPTMSKY